MTSKAAAPRVPRPTPPCPIGRIPVTKITPVREGGRWPAKAVVGEAVPVGATVFKEGHDAVGATAVLIGPDGKAHSAVRMHPVGQGLDRWEAWVVPDAVGRWQFRVEAWADPYATWLHDAAIKVPAGIDVELMLTAGAALMDQAAGRGPAAQREPFRTAAAVLRDTKLPPAVRLAAAAEGTVPALLQANPLRQQVTKSAAYPLQVDRERALVGAWYEVFPRSVGAAFKPSTGWQSGTLRTCAAGLDRIAAMGFDVVYLTPVHPIGTTFRKGR
ncbi:MAG: DUF3416 domain-containing protein, partial [Bifidobacteriaceae bacterium]|nr:DUF3416 domain-containing protein [Bifidobacteriaceae bacterium]